MKNTRENYTMELQTSPEMRMASMPKKSPETEALIAQIRAMSPLEQIESILLHEREIRGLDRLALSNQNSAGVAQAIRLSREYLRNFRSALSVANESVPEFTKMYLAAECNESRVNLS